MGASFRAEILKLRKRPAMWGLGLLLITLVLLFHYVLPYVGYVSAVTSESATGGARVLDLGLSLPGGLVENLIGVFGLEAGVIALILGALAAGSEYGWGTIRVVLTQRPTRLAVYAGKVLAVGVVVAVITLALFAIGAAASVAITNLEGEAVRQASEAEIAEGLRGRNTGLTDEQLKGVAADFASDLREVLAWPPATEIAKGMGAAWLILAVWAAVGLGLATLFRSGAFAVGLGLTWLLVVEALIGDLAAGVVGWIETLAKAFPGANAGSLILSFDSGGASRGQVAGMPEPVGAIQAICVLAAYLVAFLALGALLVHKRDVS